MIDVLHGVGVGILWTAVWTLCMAGLILSCLSLSGTWMVTIAALLAVPLTPDSFPGIGAVLLFAAVCGSVEIAEVLAGYLGVKQRGGSNWAGAAAAAGGFAGLLLGSMIPVPILGTLAGMLAGSFGFAFVVERYRLRQSGRAARIATGAVFARIAVLILKVAATLGLAAALVSGVLRG